MSSSTQVLTTSNSSASYVNRTADLVAAAFGNDALNRYFILSADSILNEAIISQERLVQHFLPGIKRKVAKGALLIEAGDWAGAALWVPPGVRNPRLESLSDSLLEFLEKSDKVKESHIGDRDYWYLNLIGRHPERHEAGVVRALILPFLRRAKAAGLPAYVEASNGHARDVYAHYGFRVVETVRIGGGKADRNGNIVPGGEGVLTYAMVAEPENIQ